MTRDMKVGFIGLGSMGAPIARRIMNAGWPLTVWGRPAASLAPFEGSAATVAGSAPEVAANCDLLGICVNADDDVRDVLITQGALEAMRPGTIVAIHSTILPGTMTELEAAAIGHGVRLIDTPVTGGPRGAEAGTLTVMVGGDAETLARIRPVLDSFAANIPHMGPLGAGQLMKLLNNNLAFANMIMGMNALELAADLGMDVDVVASVLKVGSGASGGLNVITDETLFTKIRGPVSSMNKEIHHLTEVARQRGLGDPELVRITAATPERLDRFASRVGSGG